MEAARKVRDLDVGILPSADVARDAPETSRKAEALESLSR